MCSTYGLVSCEPSLGPIVDVGAGSSASASASAGVGANVGVGADGFAFGCGCRCSIISIDINVPHSTSIVQILSCHAQCRQVLPSFSVNCSTGAGLPAPEVRLALFEGLFCYPPAGSKDVIAASKGQAGGKGGYFPLVAVQVSMLCGRTGSRVPSMVPHCPQCSLPGAHHM